MSDSEPEESDDTAVNHPTELEDSDDTTVDHLSQAMDESASVKPARVEVLSAEVRALHIGTAPAGADPGLVRSYSAGAAPGGAGKARSTSTPIIRRWYPGGSVNSSVVLLATDPAPRPLDGAL